jgi:hypothetical protein
LARRREGRRGGDTPRITRGVASTPAVRARFARARFAKARLARGHGQPPGHQGGQGRFARGNASRGNELIAPRTGSRPSAKAAKEPIAPRLAPGTFPVCRESPADIVMPPMIRP